MWQNFKDMPAFLKIFTIHALCFLIGGFISLLPFDIFSINGKEATYQEWWGSGVGIYFLLTALSIGVCGILLVKKAKYSREIYFTYLFVFLLGSAIKDSSNAMQTDFIIITVIFLSLIFWYLFFNKNVKAFYEKNL